MNRRWGGTGMNIRTLIDGQPEKNDVQNGIFPFRANVYTYLTPQKIITSHYHKIIEILVVRSGSLLCICNGRTLRAEENDILFFNPYDTHELETEDHANYDGVFLDPNIFVGKNFPALDKTFLALSNNSVVIQNLISDERILSFLNSVLWHQDPTVEIAGVTAIGYLLVLLSELISRYPVRTHSPSVSASELCRPVLDILKHINENYYTELKVPQLAAMAGFSTAYFCRKFKQMTNDTPIEYINAVRIKNAMEYLTNTQLSVTDIAVQVGFNNIGYFNKQFRKIAGCTPSAFRHRNLPLAP